MDKKVNFERELELLFAGHIKQEKGDETFLKVTSDLRLYFSCGHMKKLIESEELERLDEYLSCFASNENMTDQEILKTVREIIFWKCCEKNDFNGAIKCLKKIQLLPQKFIQPKYLRQLTLTFYDEKELDNVRKRYDGFDQFIQTNLYNDLISKFDDNSSFKMYLEFPVIKKDTLKKLVSHGISFDHIKLCQGSVDDKIGLVSLIKPEHFHVDGTPVSQIPSKIISEWKCVDIQIPYEITCLYVNESRIFIGFKNGQLYCVDFTTGEVIFSIQEPTPIRLISVISCYVVYWNGNEVKLFSVGHSLSLLSNITIQSVTSLAMVNGTTQIAIVDNIGLKIYDFISKAIVYQQEGVVGVAPSPNQCELFVVFPSVLEKIKANFGKPFEVVKKQQLSIPIDHIVDESILVSNDNKYIVIPNEKIRNIYSRKSGSSILAGNDCNVLIYSQGTFQIVDTETQQPKKQFNSQPISLASADNKLIVGLIENSLQMKIIHQGNTIKSIDWNKKIIKEQISMNTHVASNDFSSEIPQNVAQVAKVITHSQLEPVKRQPEPVTVEVAKKVQPILPPELPIKQKIVNCLIEPFCKITGIIKLFSVVENGKHLMVQTINNQFYVFKKIDATQYQSSFPKEKRVLDFSKEKSLVDIKGVITRTGTYMIVSLGKLCELYRCSSALKVAPFCQITDEKHISSLEMFPLDCNNVLVGFSNGMVSVFRANKQFVSVSIPKELNGEIHSFVFLPNDSNENDVRFYIITKNGEIQLVQFNKRTPPMDQLVLLASNVILKNVEIRCAFIGNDAKHLYVVGKDKLFRINTSNMTYDQINTCDTSYAAISNDSQTIVFLTSDGLMKMATNKWGIFEKIILPKESTHETTHIIPFEHHFLISNSNGEIMKLKF